MSETDESIVSCHSWAETFSSQLIDITKSCALNWCNILIKLGLEENSRNEWISIFLGQANELYSQMVQEVTDHQSRVLDEIERLLQESERLCKILHISMPEYGSEKKTLFEERHYLKEMIKKYTEIVQNKMGEISALNEIYHSLCQSLGIPSEPLITSKEFLPSDQMIVEFKYTIEELQLKEYERLQIFMEKQTTIQKLVQELQYEPDLDFEKNVISESNIPMTHSNMAALENFVVSLQQRFEETKQEISLLRNQIKELWDLLAEDVKYRDDFLQTHTGNSLKTLQALRNEVKRCEDSKKANIEIFVKRLREEMLKLWDKCHIADQFRDFDFLHADVYTEDLLALHDMEIQKLKEYYTNNKELLYLIEKRTELWDKMLQLEEREKSKDRYKNRGGQLLMEEKERNGVLKRIPKIEEKMLELAKTYEEIKGTQFLSWGSTVEHIIQQDHINLKQEKKLKVSARKEKQDKTVTPGKSQNLTPLFNSNSLKRKPVVTPLFSAKRTRVLGNHNVPSAVPKIKITNAQVVSSRISGERNKRMKRVKRISKKFRKNKNKENLNISSDYEEFENKMEHTNYRSTSFNAGSYNLAVPLPVTPKTPQRIPHRVISTTNNRVTPRTNTKLAPAPQCKFNF